MRKRIEFKLIYDTNTHSNEWNEYLEEKSLEEALKNLEKHLRATVGDDFKIELLKAQIGENL